MAATAPLRWGIIGTGGIARGFADDLRHVPAASLVAVGSRSQHAADAFADEYGVARRHPSYAALAADPEVDAVYVATPHPMHRDDAMLAIEAGKAVLVEKAFTVNAAQARELVDAARRRGTFLMEAMWTRFLPHTASLRDLVADGSLGEVRTVVADHGQWFVQDASHRLFDPELGGGALLDLGVYPVSFASMLLGPPSRVTAVSTPAFTGVDAQTSMVLEHDGGAQAVLSCTLEAVTPTTAVVVGTEARVELEGSFYAPTAMTVVRRDGSRERLSWTVEGRGMHHEAAEVARCLAAGLTESPLMPLDETVAVMATMDEVRRQIGLTYPSERADG